MNIYQRIILILGVIILINVLWEPRIRTYIISETIPFNELTYIQKTYKIIKESRFTNVLTYEEYLKVLRKQSREEKKKFYNRLFAIKDYKIDWRGCKPKSYQDFERKIVDSFNNPNNVNSPDHRYYKGKRFSLEFKERISIIDYLGVITCILLLFFALKGIGRKKEK